MVGNGPLSRHRIQIWNKHQHPYLHRVSEFAYTNEAIPDANNLQETLDYLIAVLYPLSQTAVATPADLPAGGNTLAVDDTTDTFTAAGHGYKDTDMVRIASTGTLPAPLLANQSYFMKNVTANTFQLALTPDPLEPVIDITTTGTGTITVENVLASYRVVTDDGDGKAAAYRWQKMPFEAVPSWHKVYDMDWSQDSILAAFQDVTQDLYVYQKGKQDLDNTGTPYAGVDSGQNVYGGAEAGANFNLYSNFIDPTTGFIQFGSQVSPKLHNIISLGENARRFVNLYLAGIAQIGNTTYGDGNINAAGGVVDFNDNDITTTGDVTADNATLNTAEIGNLNFATNVITSDSNIISMLNQVLQDLAQVISQQVTVSDGVNTLDLTVGALASVYDSSSGVHSFANQDLEDINELTATTVNFTTANIGNFVIAGDTITNPNPVTIDSPDVTFTGDVTADNLEATGQVKGATGELGNYTFDATDISTVAPNSDINLNPNGTGQNVFKKLARAVTDATLSLGTAAFRWTTLFLSGGLSDGTNSISIAQLLSFRNANAGAANGDSLFYDSVSGQWLPSNPDTEIDHDTLNNLTTGDAGHTQFVMLAGRAGGQNVRGGTLAGETLTLQGNAADATNGDVIFASHLTPSVTGTKDLGKTANRIRDLYATGQNFGLRDENTATANNFGGTSVGRRYFNTAVAEPYSDAGTFAKYAMHTDVVTNSTLTGSAQTVPFTLENIVVLTNAGLVSISDIAIQADIRGNRFKFLVNETGVNVTIINGSIITGTGSDFTLEPDASALFLYDGSNYRMATGAGSGSGVGGINYIEGGDAENGTVGWVGYNDGASARPVDGTGGVVTGVTFATSNVTPLRGDNSFLLTRVGIANYQGQGFSYDFTIDEADRGKALQISFDYLVSVIGFTAGSRTTDGDMIVYIYDVTNARLIEPSNFKLYSQSTTVPDKYQGTFQTAIDSTSYRLILHQSGSGVVGYTLKIEDIRLGPSNYVFGSPESDWFSVTPTFSNFGSPTSVNFEARRNGPNLQLRGNFTPSAVGAGIASIGLPLGLRIKTGVPSLSVANGTTWFSASGNPGFVNDSQVLMTGGDSGVTFQAAATGTKQSAASNNLTAAGVVCNVHFEVPIEGWSSSVQMSDSSDTRVVSFMATNSGSALAADTTAITANWTVNHDSHGAWTTNTYTIPVSGYYNIVAGVGMGATVSTTRAAIYIGGVQVRNALSYSAAVGSGVAVASAQLHLVQGQTITVQGYSSGGGTTNPNQTYLEIELISGPSAIAATELISLTYRNNAGQSIPNATLTTITGWTKLHDTHNCFNPTTGIFTAPASGVFHFSIGISFGDLTAAGDRVVHLYDESGAAIVLQHYRPYNVLGSGVTTQVITGDIQLVAGRQYSVKVEHSAGVNQTISASLLRNYISIKRVGL